MVLIGLVQSLFGGGLRESYRRARYVLWRVAEQPVWVKIKPVITLLHNLLLVVR
jgi:hypothetical protein